MSDQSTLNKATRSAVANAHATDAAKTVTKLSRGDGLRSWAKLRRTCENGFTRNSAYSLHVGTRPCRTSCDTSMTLIASMAADMDATNRRSADSAGTSHGAETISKQIPIVKIQKGETRRTKSGNATTAIRYGARIPVSMSIFSDRSQLRFCRLTFTMRGVTRLAGARPRD